MSENSRQLTMESKIGELYASPIGHDAIYKVLLQLGLSEKIIQSPMISNLKLSTVAARVFDTPTPHKAL